VQNIDIETFYSKIRLSMIDAKAHAKNDSLSLIIRACRLKPAEVFSKKFTFKRSLYRKWYDEFYNSIYIENEIKLTIGDLSAPKHCTDLFYGNSIKTTAKNSKFALFAIGYDFCFAAFYGHDEYIRAFVSNK
jgi:hypothetical protein